MIPVILYRNDVDWRQEESCVRKYFSCISSRLKVNKGDLVIPRFSALPFFKELQDDIEYFGATLINNYNQHRYIADLCNWYYDLAEFTPMTWNDLTKIPENGPFVLKGETNSKKFLWNSHMFAEDKKKAIEIHSRLQEDSLIQYQKIYIRKYVELERLGIGFSGLPITKEFRIFVYQKEILSIGFYWSNYEISADPNEVPLDFVNTVIDRIQNTEICEPPNYYVIDVAKTTKGDWIVIELNDGSMSGLSDNNPEILYKNLKMALSK